MRVYSCAVSVQSYCIKVQTIFASAIFFPAHKLYVCEQGKTCFQKNKNEKKNQKTKKNIKKITNTQNGRQRYGRYDDNKHNDDPKKKNAQQKKM